MLKESALVPNSDIGKNTGGFHLGPVGGRIVGVVFALPVGTGARMGGCLGRQ